MTCAVVMSTYNGEKYIVEQLDSIRLQTVLPDEVIISDDCSSDSTPEMVRNYIVEHNLVNWCFSVNEKNVGWKKNFYKLIDECRADLIFLSDQDDVWNKRKLEFMIPVFNDGKVNLLACDYKNKSSGIDVNYECSERYSVKQIYFSHKFMWVDFPGCTYCIRKSYFDGIKKWWREWLPHDAFLFRNALLDGSLYNIKSDLIIHRMHGNNAGTPKNFAQQRDDLQYYFDVLELLEGRAQKENIPTDKIAILTDARLWLESRKNFYSDSSFLRFLNLAKFIRFYPHIKSYVKEFFVGGRK